MANNTTLFATANSNAAASNARQLSGTARLTSFADRISRELINKLAADESSDDDKQLIINAQTSAEALDQLVDLANDQIDGEYGWLADIESDDLEKMLKSQQSKRSRARSKDMTVDNFSSMLSAAIAEKCIRMALGKPKGASGARHAGKRYTDEEIQALANDQVALRKAIRSIQSKKSIMKSKANWDESAPAYQELLEDEKKLLAVRIGAGHADLVKTAVKELLTDVDTDKLKAGDARGLLDKILVLVNS